VHTRNIPKKVLIVFAITSVAILVIAGSTLALAALKISSSAGTTAAQEEAAPRGLEYPEAAAIWGGAVAVIGSTMASSLALREIARAGFAASAEKPELAVWIVVMGGLAEGIAIYGLLVAIIILGKI